MKQQTNIIDYNPDDILLICNNVEQAIEHLIVEFKTLNKQEKAEIIVMFENSNTYVGQLLKTIYENSKPKKKSKKSNNVDEKVKE
ncbi:MAG: hypothetical protein LLF98_02640 [Clostridium sp.]|uniref:hypothetical protein n=1 Tax=Clostridium sp. TaxID=1506 RepID=UPI0025C5A928|nr:hypothetical protein [Clostridium sp.]MCE5220181.1 hypothetical protein [Clostridium sp.]